MDKQRLREIIAEEIAPNVMKKYYGINGKKGFQLVEATTLNRFLTKHANNGYVAISACRSSNSSEENERLTKSLLNDIESRNYSYIPTYGGYQVNGVENADYEPSFIVCNYNRKGEPLNFDDLKDFAIEMCDKYNQDSVMIYPPKGTPYYAGCNGEVVSNLEHSSRDNFKNDYSQEFFTSFVPKEKVEQNKEKGFQLGRRYTSDIQFESVRLNPSPETLNERMRRSAKGEIWLEEDKQGNKNWWFNKKTVTVINEASRSEKRRRNIEAEKMLTNPSESNLKTIAVFTAENPDSTPTPKINKKVNRALSQELKNARYVVIPARGKFDNLEHSFAVLNISLEAAMAYCGKYQQTSFVFSVNNNGELISEYWEKADPTQPYDESENPYVKKDSEPSLLRMDDADNYYTQIGGFKFSIPFSIFECVKNNVNRLIVEGKAKNKSIVEFAMKRGQSPYLWRGAIYKGLI